MPWSEDQSTPSYAARPALSLRAFLKPSEPEVSNGDAHTPVLRASGIVPRTARTLAPPHAEVSRSQPVAAVVQTPAPERRSATVSSLRPRRSHAAPVLPERVERPQPAPQAAASADAAKHDSPPLPAATRISPSQPAQARGVSAPRTARTRPTLPNFALQELLSDPLVWLGNPQRALLLLALVSSTTVFALLSFGGFLDHLTGP